VGSKRSLFVRCLIMRVHPTGPGRASGRLLLRVKKHGLRSSGLQHGLSMFQYTRSKYQKCGIAQSVYVTQGFSPVTCATGTDGTMGTVEKKK